MELSTLPREQKSINWVINFPPSSPSFEEQSIEKIKGRIWLPFESSLVILAPKEIRSASLTDEIKQLFEFYHTNFSEIRNEVEIVDFLLARVSVVKYLFEAPQKIFEYFGENQGLALEIIRDPEGEYEELFLYIKTNLEPDDALNCLDKLDKEWFLNIPQQEILDFNINFEFI